MRRTQIIPTQKNIDRRETNAPSILGLAPVRKTPDAQENRLGRGHYTANIREMWSGIIEAIQSPKQVWSGKETNTSHLIRFKEKQEFVRDPTFHRGLLGLEELSSLSTLGF